MNAKFIATGPMRGGFTLDRGRIKEVIAAAGGPTMSKALPLETFQNLLGPAKQLRAQYLPQIQLKAATLDAGQIIARMRA
jgi:hypothetical protein